MPTGGTAGEPGVFLSSLVFGVLCLNGFYGIPTRLLCNGSEATVVRCGSKIALMGKTVTDRLHCGIRPKGEKIDPYRSGLREGRGLILPFPEIVRVELSDRHKHHAYKVPLAEGKELGGTLVSRLRRSNLSSSRVQHNSVSTCVTCGDARHGVLL
jgi:hypothetical protein